MCSKSYPNVFLILIISIQIVAGSCNDAMFNDGKTIRTEGGSVIHENDVALKLVELEKKQMIKQSELKEPFLLFANDTIISILNDIHLGYRLSECSEKWTVFQDKNYFIVSGIAMKDMSTGYLFSIVYETTGPGKYTLINCQVGDENLRGSYPLGIIPDR